MSFLGLGRVFTANMTGNVVFLAFAIAGAAGLSVGASLLELGCFLGGAVGGGRLARATESSSPRRWLSRWGCATPPFGVWVRSTSLRPCSR